MKYEAPDTAERAAELLAAESGIARVLAGGTDLLVQMRTDMIEPALVVDIKKIAEVRKITEEKDGSFRIGAAVTGAELREHARLKAQWPGLVEGANLIGSTQVQGRATLGGNLCNASPAADSVPGLIAAGAKAVIVGPKGRREVPVEDVVTGVRKLSLNLRTNLNATYAPMMTSHCRPSDNLLIHRKYRSTTRYNRFFALMDSFSPSRACSLLGLIRSASRNDFWASA